MDIRISKKVFNEVYLPQLNNYDTRFNIYYGGGGSGKSKFVVQKMILKALKMERKMLVIRKVGSTIRDSIFAEFKTVIVDWRLSNQVKARETLLQIDFVNGSSILFKSLDDPEKIKSISGIDDIIIEEATEIDEMDFSQLNLRLRSKKPYNQMHLMFNPISKSNWVYKKWFAETANYNKENTMILKTTYLDNKFLPRDYIDSLEEYKQTNLVYYKIYALGEFASLDKLVYENWEEKEFDYREILKREGTQALFGLDFGYINDPSAFIALVVDEAKKEIYIFDEFYKKGLLNDEIAKEIKLKGYHKEVIIADSAEQKSVEEIKRLGVNRIKGAKKIKIIDGIQFLKQYKIYVHPLCKNSLEEFKNYTWKKNKISNEYINEPIDKYNHLLDALRYAILQLRKNNRLQSLKITGI